MTVCFLFMIKFIENDYNLHRSNEQLQFFIAEFIEKCSIEFRPESFFVYNY